METISNSFLNIAGLGPIFGVIQGALFGPAAFLWITLGTIFIGAVHDFFSGFLSLRNDGFTMPDIVSKYLGNTTQKLVAVFTVITCILIASVFFNRLRLPNRKFDKHSCGNLDIDYFYLHFDCHNVSG